MLHNKGGITPNLLQGILVITWQESYGSGYAGNAQQTVDSLLQYGLPQTQDVDEDGCSATPTSQPLSGFRCFEYGVLGVYAENQNAAGTPTTGAVSELKDAKVHAVEYLFLLEEQHWAEGVLQAAELAHDLGEISDYFPELFEIAAAATAYVAPANCASSLTRGGAV